MQARKLRYLSAMGIDCWVRRSLQRPVPVPDAVPDTVPDAGAGRSGGPERPVVSVRTLLEDVPQPDPPQPVSGEAVARVVPEERNVTSERAPEFRLVILRLDSALLLVDESLLAVGEEQAGQLLLLGDLLRAAVLLRHGTAGGRIERQVFYWPQLEDSAMDQSLPRAREALAFHLRTRLDERDGERDGPLLLVADPEAGAAASGSAIALTGLEALAAQYCLVDPRILAEDVGAATRRDVWRSLQDLWRAS